jgi:hypothetical protein
MAIIHEGPAPYAPVAHVLRAVEHYRERAPDAFSKELLMKLGYPDAYATRTLKALKLLDLMESDGTPTNALKELRVARAEEYTARFEQVVRTAYAEVFAVVDPATGSPTAIQDAFRFYNPAAQREKMVTLFMGLCEAAGIIGPERAPRKRLRAASAARANEARETKRAVVQAAKTPPRVEPPVVAPVVNPPVADSEDALRVRYVDMLLKKAETQDEIDTGLLDRIEALLYEKRGGDGGHKD